MGRHLARAASNVGLAVSLGWRGAPGLALATTGAAPFERMHEAYNANAARRCAPTAGRPAVTGMAARVVVLVRGAGAVVRAVLDGGAPRAVAVPAVAVRTGRDGDDVGGEALFEEPPQAARDRHAEVRTATGSRVIGAFGGA
jgi:hypothetical protein